MKIPASTLKKMAAGAGSLALAGAIAAQLPASHATTTAPEAPESVVQDRILDIPTTDPPPNPTPTAAPTATPKPRPRPVPRAPRDPCPGCGMG